MSDNTEYGDLYPTTILDDFNRERYRFQKMIQHCYASLPVRVLEASGGGLAAVGQVTVQPLVKQTTANNKLVDYPILNNVPYFRIQGGTNAIIIDPEIGDMGLACFCSRDITSVKRVRGEAPAGSLRKMDLSDAIYIGGIFNATPVQYIQFSQSGITVFSPNNITLQAPAVIVDAASSVTMDTPLLTVTGKINMTGSKGSGAAISGGLTNTGGTLSSNGIVLDTHTHGGVTSGGSSTGVPQ